MHADELFNVVQVFDNGTYEYVRRGVPAEEAVRAAHHYCSSVGARVGFVRQVLITDGGDCCNFQWRYGEHAGRPFAAGTITYRGGEP